MGRHPAAGPIHPRGAPLDDGERHERLDGGAHGRGSGHAHQQHRSEDDDRLRQEPDNSRSPPSRARSSRSATGTCSSGSRSCLPTARPSSPSRRRKVSCTRLPNSIRSATTGPRTKCRLNSRLASERDRACLKSEATTRAAWLRETGGNVEMKPLALAILVGSAFALSEPGFRLQDLRLQREATTLFPSSIRRRWRSSRPSMSASARAASPSRRTASSLLCASDDNTIEMIDTATPSNRRHAPLRPRPGTFRAPPDGNPLYVANEDDNLVTVVDIRSRRPSTRSRSASSRRAWGSARRQGAGEHFGNHQHGAFHRHRPRTRSSTTCWSIRGRASPSSSRRAEVWVIRRDRWHGHVIDTATREVKKKIAFEIPGLRPRRSSPSACALPRTARRPSSRSARPTASPWSTPRPTRSRNTCWSASASGTWPSRPTRRRSFDQRGLQRRVGHRCGEPGGHESIQVGRLPGAPS